MLLEFADDGLFAPVHMPVDESRAGSEHECWDTQALRDASVSCLDMATCGLLPLMLRCMACRDDELRSLAYEAVALYETTLDRSNFR